MGRSGSTCAVAVCKSPKTSTGVLYHRFPKLPDLQKAWIVACKRKYEINPQTGKFLIMINIKVGYSNILFDMNSFYYFLRTEKKRITFFPIILC